MLLQASGEWLKVVLPDDLDKYLKKRKPDEEQTDGAPPAAADGYSKAARDEMKNQVDKAVKR